MLRLSVCGLALLGVLSGCAGRAQPSGAAPAAAATPSVSATAPSPAASSPAPSAPPSASAVPPPVVPAKVTAGIVVFDRQTGTYVYNLNPAHRFRSASLVKLLIVLDLLWGKDAVPAADRAQLDIMLRSSDDAAATRFWKRGGQRAVVSRMVARLGLTDSAPPPADKPGFWGYTALSAGDVVRVYRYLLESAAGPVREYVLGNLRQSTRCGTDRYDQSFGIPGAVARPWAVKQGWSGFGDRPATPCTVTAALPVADNAALPVALPFAENAAPNPPDMLGEVLHTTGTVGAEDRVIVAVLSVFPNATPYATATRDLTALVRSLAIPGALPLPG